MLWVVELIFNLTRESICGEAPATRSNDTEGGYSVVCRIVFFILRGSPKPVQNCFVFVQPAPLPPVPEALLSPRLTAKQKPR